MGEKKGRSKKGSILDIWWFDYGHIDLFSYTDRLLSENKIKAVIDANVFYDLQDSSSKTYKESTALLNGWLEDIAEYCITREIYNEIRKNSDKEKRNQHFNYASSFQEVNCSPDIYKQSVEKIKTLFTTQSNKSDSADQRHLAWTLGADVPFFITHDEDILKKSEEAFKLYGLSIVKPSIFIINQDALIRDAEYQPFRLSGTEIKVEKFNEKKC